MKKHLDFGGYWDDPEHIWTCNKCGSEFIMLSHEVEGLVGCHKTDCDGILSLKDFDR